MSKELKNLEGSVSQQNSVKEVLSDILLDVSWADVSRKYFGKSNAWLYHKFEGVDDKKNTSPFTDEERVLLKGALVDLATRIRRAADRLC